VPPLETDNGLPHGHLLAGTNRGASVWRRLAEPGRNNNSAGFRFAKRRGDWRLGRWTAKNAVAMRLGARLERAGLRNVEIRAAASGAPKVFFEGECAPLSLSLSHRAGLGACVIGTPGMALGCDLEFVEPHSATFAADYFLALEQELVMAAVLVNRDWLLALLWSAKEVHPKPCKRGSASIRAA